VTLIGEVQNRVMLAAGGFGCFARLALYSSTALQHRSYDPVVHLADILLFVSVLGTALRRRPVAAEIAAGDSVIALVYLLYLAGY
jgi:hypothetical protein